MKKSGYCVQIEDDSLTFSAIHSVFLNKNSRPEPLHGHDFKVRIAVYGPLNEMGYVIDFVTLKLLLQTQLNRLHHKILLPRRHAQIQYRIENHTIDLQVLACKNPKSTSNLEMKTPDILKHWLFPEEDVCFFEFENVTTENLAYWIAQKLWSQLESQKLFAFSASQYRMSLVLEESPGCCVNIDFEQAGAP